MRFIAQTTPGDASSLVISEEGEIPYPNAREVLIRVTVASLNRLDLLQAQGKYVLPPGVSPILGIEVAGTIISKGSECQRDDLAEGDAVCALLQGGGYAEFASCDERTVFKAIPCLSMQQMAAIPEAFLTAYQLAFFVAKLQPGESCLLHAAASSVGQAAIQMLVRKGIKVFATTRSQDKCCVCLSLGATAAFVPELDEGGGGGGARFADIVKAANGGQGVDVVLCPVGATYFSENVNVLQGIGGGGVVGGGAAAAAAAASSSSSSPSSSSSASSLLTAEEGGRLVLYGLMSGASVQDLSVLSKLMAKRISIHTSTLRNRSIAYKDALVQAFVNDLDGLPSIQTGEIKVQVDATFEFDEVLQAHAHMSRNQNTGKICLNVSHAASATDFLRKELQGIAERNK